MNKLIITIAIGTSLIGCASKQVQVDQTKAIWPKVEAAIENRDELSANTALSSLGNYLYVEDDNGEFYYFETSVVSSNIAKIINTLKNCDLGIQNNNRREINKCTSGTDNHLKKA